MLEVGAGTGTNVPLIAERVGASGWIVGLDISRAMLRRCDEKLRRQGRKAALIEAEAAHLPFAPDAFDAVLHHGGFAEFGNKRGAIDEMVRVAKPHARIVICDAALPTDHRLSLASRLLLRLQPDYRRPPPMDLLPPDATDAALSWFHAGAWYLIEFSKPER